MDDYTRASVSFDKRTKSETPETSSQVSSTSLPYWPEYNRAVAKRLSMTAAAELAARAFTNNAKTVDLERFEFRFCLPGSGGYAGYRDLITGELRFFRHTQTGFIELGEVLHKAA
jgi:hypothetical protein